jgi:hypothetical protein
MIRSGLSPSPTHLWLKCRHFSDFVDILRVGNVEVDIVRRTIGGHKKTGKPHSVRFLLFLLFCGLISLAGYQGCQIVLAKKHTKTGKIFQITTNIPNGHKIDRMAVKKK